MSDFTNSGLVEYCKAALTKNTAYMWGGLFRTITTGYINQLKKIYPDEYVQPHLGILEALVGKGYYGCDCIGLIKSYYFGGIGSPDYVSSKDYNVPLMYNNAVIKGEIDTFDKVPGRLVMTENLKHVGVYIGDDQVIECTLKDEAEKGGVIQSTFNSQWKKWCQCIFIDDDTSESNNHSTKNIYLSIGVAAIRKSPSTTGEFVSRCVRGNYYPASHIITSSNNSQNWFQHAGTNYYSALTDSDGSSLFSLYGTYVVGKTNAVVNVRTDASITSAIVAKLQSNAVVYLTGTTKATGGYTWAQIVYHGKLCWCDKQWINA
ncbi:MAG: NlpC/P60 family protein [Eubacterium sp.]|nr:NlpC/P60 family protein [Eubacterium sp.]